MKIFMNKKQFFEDFKKFLHEEKIEVSVIITIAITLYLIGVWIEKHASEHQDLATNIPLLSILAGVILFAIQYAMMHKKIFKLKSNYDKSQKPRYLFKAITIAVSSVSFLFADLVVAYSLSMSYFAFAFNAGTEAFPEAWHQLHIAEILFPILSIFSLWCLRLK
jgi:hypothetical protein